MPVEEYARRWKLSPGTAWKHYNLAAPLVHDLCECGRSIVSEDLWRVLESMRRNPLLGGRLLELHPVVSRRIGRDADLSELRFARTCML